MRRMTLLINADDTLWESNVFFEKTIEHFFALVEPFGYPRDYARRILNETERLNIRQHGYGVRSFGRSLEETYLKLGGSLAQRSALQEVSAMVNDLERTPPRVLDGVPETLSYLAARHRMILFTKGEPAEQAAKVERSGLQGFFDAIEIVAEKSVAAYQSLVDRHHVVKSHGWMVGNNPRTEINPALQAGLNAAFVPHFSTWEHDRGELQSGAGKLLIVARFRDLRDHF
ncbi:MAG TPA: HAD hydrolase-like protein [Candidatus Acidoferrales bacterium]|jgi:putative hydrolase of the HAD superfamily